MRRDPLPAVFVEFGGDRSPAPRSDFGRPLLIPCLILDRSDCGRAWSCRVKKEGVLNLSEAQEVQLRAAMESGEQKLENLSRRKPNTYSPFKAFLEEGAALQTAMDEEVKALLSGDQRTGLELQTSRELRTQAEVKAGGQMAKLQDNLILTGEQQDAAFQMYAHQALALDPVKIIGEGREPAEVMEEQLQASKKQLQLAAQQGAANVSAVLAAQP